MASFYVDVFCNALKEIYGDYVAKPQAFQQDSILFHHHESWIQNNPSSSLIPKFIGNGEIVSKPRFRGFLGLDLSYGFLTPNMWSQSMNSTRYKFIRIVQTSSFCASKLFFIAFIVCTYTPFVGSNLPDPYNRAINWCLTVKHKRISTTFCHLK